MQDNFSEIYRIDSVTGDIYIRSHLIKDDFITNNKWWSKNSESYAKTAEGMPVIVASMNPILHKSRIWSYLGKNKWKIASQKAAVGIIEKVDWNEKLNTFDAIWKVINESYKAIIRKGYLPKFTSPALWSEKPKRDSKNNIVYDEYEIIHLALLSENPAFRELANSNYGMCEGTKECISKLAAVAETESLNNEQITELESSFSKIDFDVDNIKGFWYNNATQSVSDMIKNISYYNQEIDDNKLDMDNNVSVQDLVKLQTENSKSADMIKELQEKLKEQDVQIKSLTELKDTSLSEKAKIETERDALILENNKKYFGNELAVLPLYSDETKREAKIKELIEAKTSVTTFDRIFGDVIKHEKESKLKNELSSSDKPQLSNAGVASTETQNKKNAIGDGIKIALALAGRLR